MKMFKVKHAIRKHPRTKHHWQRGSRAHILTPEERQFEKDELDRMEHTKGGY